MKFEEGKITTQKTARFSTFGSIKTATNVWFVLHGYGQLSTYFIRKFSTLDPRENFVVAPEGLHRFYLKNSSGRVGASWMTKEARVDDIEDYIHYLNQIYQQYVEFFKKGISITVLGFSQGAATACRWIAAGNYDIQHLVLWAGVFPPDLDLNQTLPALNSSRIIYCIGNDDIYFSKEKQQEVFAYLNEIGIKYEILPYSGGHTISADTLADLEKIITAGKI